MNATDFKVPRKPRNQPEAPVIVGPAASYQEYVPDRAMRAAMARAARDQPPLVALASTVLDVPAYQMRSVK